MSGHGGIWDRVDFLFFTAPTAWPYVRQAGFGSGLMKIVIRRMHLFVKVICNLCSEQSKFQIFRYLQEAFGKLSGDFSSLHHQDEVL